MHSSIAFYSVRQFVERLGNPSQKVITHIRENRRINCGDELHSTRTLISASAPLDMHVIHCNDMSINYPEISVVAIVELEYVAMDEAGGVGLPGDRDAVVLR